MNFLKKPFAFAIIFAVLLTAASALTLLDSFVFPHDSIISEDEQDKYVYVPRTTEEETTAKEPASPADDTSDAVPDVTVPDPPQTTADTDVQTTKNNISVPGTTGIDTTGIDTTGSDTIVTEPGTTEQQTTEPETEDSPFTDYTVISDNSYSDKNIAITITKNIYTDSSGYRTVYYLADIRLRSAEYLKTAFSYNQNRPDAGKLQTVADNASSLGAIFAINGDGCVQHRDYGYIVRNTNVYRDIPYTDRTKREDLVIYSDGEFGIINEKSDSAECEAQIRALMGDGAVNIFSFGPALVRDGEICVGKSEEISSVFSKDGNPRTAVGYVDKLHYVFVVADGRTTESRGLFLYELAGILKDAGCSIAYNLDGGGSSTMWFDGRVVNYPTTNGDYSERKVSDIVYIGY